MLKIGSPAPEFEMFSTAGKMVKLSEFRGEKHVLLVFYPWAFTRVCTSEFCALREDNRDLLEHDDLAVFGVSADPVPSLRAWKKEQEFPVDFLSDFWPHGKVSHDFGIFEEALGVPKRGTFLIDKDGILRWMEVNEIPDARDQGTWRKALADLRAG